MPTGCVKRSVSHVHFKGPLGKGLKLFPYFCPLPPVPPRAAVWLQDQRKQCHDPKSSNCVWEFKKAPSACEMSAVLKWVFSLLKTECLKTLEKIRAKPLQKKRRGWLQMKPINSPGELLVTPIVLIWLPEKLQSVKSLIIWWHAALNRSFLHKQCKGHSSLQCDGCEWHAALRDQTCCFSKC